MVTLRPYQTEAKDAVLRECDYLQSSGTAIASLRDRDFCRKIATESNTKYRGADVFQQPPIL